MRYLITMIVVLALASPAMSACNTTDKIVSADFDSDLPQSITFNPDNDCEIADWYFEFFRVNGEGWLIIGTRIDCMGLTTPYSSVTYGVQKNAPKVSNTDVAISDTTQGELSIYKDSGEGSGLFKDMKLEVRNFEIMP